MLKPFAVLLFLLFLHRAGPNYDGYPCRHRRRPQRRPLSGAALSPPKQIPIGDSSANKQFGQLFDSQFANRVLLPGDSEAGFKTAAQSDIEVRVNDSVRFNITMEVGPLTETVNVKSTAPVLQTDSSSISATIHEEELQRLLLNGRQFESLVLLLPGVVTAAPNSHLSTRGGFNIDGLDEHYISFFVDGIDNVDPVIRISSYRPSIDAIQEIRVEENGYNAEFGRNGGAVVNVATKSGTNFLHGAFWEFLRNDNFDARNFFAPVGAAKPPLIRNQFGGTLGGALKRDRTFFFLAYEGLRQKTGAGPSRYRSHGADEIGRPQRDWRARHSGVQFHPVSREVLQAYPLPNRSGITGNRTEIANKIENGNDFSVRIDHAIAGQNSTDGPLTAPT